MHQLSSKFRNRDELLIWLSQWTFDRFVTLTFNDSEAGQAKIAGSGEANLFLHERLRKWDAILNSVILGKDWAKRHHDRMWSFSFLEKASVNPHWHCLIRFDAAIEDERHKQATLFDLKAKAKWRMLVPAGDADVQEIESQEAVAKYVVKSLPYGVSYEHMVVPDQFR